MRRLIIILLLALSGAPARAEPAPPVVPPARPGDAAACRAKDGVACERLAWTKRRAGDRTGALRHFHDACFRGRHAACVELGGLGLMLGDAQAAREGFEEACRYGLADGCVTLGVLDRQSKGGVTKSVAVLPERAYAAGHAALGRGETTRARRAFGDACEAAHGASCYWLAKTESQANLKESAFVHYKEACDLGVEAGCLQASAAAASRGTPADAAKWQRQACINGDAASCCKKLTCEGLDALTCFTLAERTQKACGKADALFADACAKGETLACQRGLAAQQVAKTAADLCTQGNGEACLRLAEGHLKDGRRSHASQAFAKACALKVPSACVRAALISGEDKGGALRSACAQDDGKSCYYLGQELKKTGKALEAQQYFRKACALGFGLTCETSAPALAH